MPSVIDEVLGYARLGFSIFPCWWIEDGRCACGKPACDNAGKHPIGSIVPHGFRDATKDEATLRGWWATHPKANVACATGAASGLDVFDADVPKPDKGQLADGRDTLNRHEAVHGGVDTVRSITGSGGHHLFFVHADGVKNSAKRLPGCDVRGDGGYVLLPPSSHVTGKPYAWLSFASPDDLPLSPWPPALLDAIRKPKKDVIATTPKNGNTNGTTPYGVKALAGIVDEIAAIPPGERDDRRNAICYSAGRLVAAGHVTEDDVTEAVVSACARNGLLEDKGEKNVRERIHAAVAAGVAAGPRGPAPKPPRVVTVSPDGVGEAEGHDEQATDVGNGKRLIRLEQGNLRWCKALGWLAWDGERWERDEVGRVSQAAKESARLLRVEAELLEDKDARKEARKHALTSEKAERIRAAISMAQSEEGVYVAVDRIDADPWLLCVANGTLDLRTGVLREHRREDMLTKAALTKWSESAKCPRWERFLLETFGDDADLVDFIQRAAGYTLTGLTTEQVFFLCYGVGSNGKSTMLGTLRLLLGGHATHADFSTFLVQGRGQHGPRGDLARLAGVRMVTSTEPDGSARFSESTIKAITGNDPITCAFKFQDEFSFLPAFKLWLGANHKPTIRGTDHAIWRRPLTIPFLNVVKGDAIDKNLGTILATELPGILKWAVDGCLSWQRDGLKPPPAVVMATEAYREEQDTLAEFFEDCCHIAPTYECPTSALYIAYRDWAEKGGEEPVTKNAFGRMVSERGFERGRDSSSARVYRGVSLK